MRKTLKLWRRIIAVTLSLLLVVQIVPGEFYTTVAAAVVAATAEAHTLDNGYIKVDVAKDNGGFAIYTVEGDKVTKSDNNKMLLFHSDEDDTSFTSFKVKRGDIVNEYIFGGKYKGSSKVTVEKGKDEIIATWSVDNLTFKQSISLINSGSTDHGTVYIGYSVENSGEPAQIQARMLLDTALGYQDYAYYHIGEEYAVEQEKSVELTGKSFYAVDNLLNPTITAYTLNAAVNNTECKPYQTIFAHWNNLAATVFDYTPDETLTFTNEYNKKFLTADSAVAMYYDMGTVQNGKSATVATNYGIYSNETVTEEATAAVNIKAPEALVLNADKTAYADDGYFTATTVIENISDYNYERVRVVLYTTGGVEVLDKDGKPTGSTYDNPYTFEYDNFTAGQKQTQEWKFKVSPQDDGVYGKIHYKVYDVSPDKTLNTGDILASNFLGEGRAYLLLPGTVNGIPKIQFTSASPEILYVSGVRNYFVTGKNYSMLKGQVESGAVKLMLSRTDGQAIRGAAAVEIPANNISIDEVNNAMSIIMNDTNPGVLPEGQYQLTFDYTDAGQQDLTGPALRFSVIDDQKYRNDSYGLLAVVKEGKDKDSVYKVVEFSGEEDYQAAIKNQKIKRDDVLLEFRGRFTSDEQNGEKVYTGISLNKNDNVMTLNNCLDIEDGSTTIRAKDGSVKVDFDAKIYTTGERTSVWSGVCALTELEKGGDYALITYDSNGNRDGDAMSGMEAITLLWPSVGQAAQNLLGLLLDFKYGELGVVKHSNGAQTRVVAFGASLDLSFLIPASSRNNTPPNNPLTAAHNQALQSGNATGDTLRNINNNIPYNSNTANTNATSPTGVEMGTDTGAGGGAATGGDGDNRAACIQIDDVLFGGKYLGVNFTVALGLPAYISGTPSMEAMLSVNTVGDWSFGVSGVVDFTMFYLEAEIVIKSKDNIPIPDTLRFFMGGVIPGVNVDGFGILWLQGAGGGISNLYDTIFLTQAVPPLQLIIEAQLSLMQIISARGKLMLSLQGIGLELSDGKIANALVVLQSANLQFNWYPEFYFLAAANINILDAIVGGGYIVLEESGFFEFFVRAALQIPDSIPLIGGISLAGIGIGVNTERLWGKISLLDLSVGVVYYWGGDIDWGGGSEVSPTYPSLIGMASSVSPFKDVPVYYDAANSRTLYMRTGTNFVNTVKTVVSDGSLAAAAPKAGVHSLTTTVNGLRHTLSLANKQNGKDELLMIEWSANSLAEAIKYVEDGNVTITSGNETYDITLLDHTKDASTQTNANANVTYDEETKTASLAVSFAKDEYYGKSWNIQTTERSSVILYDLEELPELNDATNINVSGSKATVNVSGSQLGKYDSITVIAVPENGSNEEARLLYKINKSDANYADIFANNTGSFTFDIPADLSSGRYDVQIIASDDNASYLSDVEKKMSYTNQNQPTVVDSINAEDGGDYMLDLLLNNGSADFDGYEITAYDENQNPVNGVSGLMYMADGTEVEYGEDGNIVLNSADGAKQAEISIGGQYQAPTDAGDVTVGFEAGKNYTIGVRKWKVVFSNGQQLLLYSDEKKSSEVTVDEPVETTWTVGASSAATKVVETSGTNTFEIPTYNTNELILTFTGSTNVTGEWVLDSGTKAGTTGSVTNMTKKVTIPLKDLEEGNHTFEFRGVNDHGDSVFYTYTFGVDTMAPRLMISSPVNGELYSANKVTIEGITDSGAKMTVVNKTTGKTLVDGKNVTVDNDGRFSVEVGLGAGLLTQTLEITMADGLGNKVTKEVTVYNDALGRIEEIVIWEEGQAGKTNNKDSNGDGVNDGVTGLNLKPGATYKLAAKARLTDGTMISLEGSDLIEWQAMAAEGTIEITEYADYVEVKVSEDAQGMVKYRFLVSSRGSYSVATSFGKTEDESQPTPTPTPTGTPSGTPTPTPTAGPSGTPTATPTASPSGTPIATPTAGPTGTPTATPTASPSGTPTATPTASPSGTPTAAPDKDPADTGDNSNMMLWLGLALLSVTTVIVAMDKERKKYKR